MAATKQPISTRYLARLLLFLDVLGIVGGLNLASWIRLSEPISFADPLLYGLVFAYLLGLYVADTYRPDTQIAGLRSPARVIVSNTATTAATTTIFYLGGLWGNEELAGRIVLGLSLIFFTLWSAAWRVLVVKWVRSQTQHSRWLVLGNLNRIIPFSLEFRFAHPQAELVLVANDSQRTDYNLKSDGTVTLVHHLSELDQYLEQSWSGILIGNRTGLSESLLAKLMQLRLRGLLVYSLVDFYEQFWFKIPPLYLKDDWFAFTSGFSLLHNPVSQKIKRLVDLVITIPLAVIILPMMVIAAIAIKLDSPGPIFYSQIRTGKQGKPFRVYKFRSMYQDAERQGAQWASDRDPRITRVGHWLRITRIDEFPQLWNVLKGEMSLIGPRPERPEFDAQLSQEIAYYQVRYFVQPGITGWAQVLYPYGASVHDAYEKLAYDLYYIKNYSLFLDIAIALKTLRVILLGKGR